VIGDVSWQMKRNLVTQSVGSLLILRQNENDPTDAEWTACIAHLATLMEAMKAEGQSAKVLVYTDGGAPNVKHRGMLQKALEKSPIHVAVVSDNLKARITSSTVALANRYHRSFSGLEWDQAYAHLGLSARERRAAEAAIKAMTIQIK
jgi:hypothetical protein